MRRVLLVPALLVALVAPTPAGARAAEPPARAGAPAAREREDARRAVRDLGLRAGALLRAARAAEAVEPAREAADLAEASLAAADPDRATAVAGLGVALLQAGRAADARPVLERALALVDAAPRPDDRVRASIARRLGRALADLARPDEALVVLRRGLADATRAGDAATLGAVEDDLGAALASAGRVEEAAEVLERALRRAEGGDANARVLAERRNDLAAVRWRQGRFDEARDLFEAALAAWEAALGADHPAVTTALQNLSVVQASLGQTDAAVRLARRAHDLSRRRAGEASLATAALASNLSVLLAERGDLDEALALAEAAVASARAALGPAHPTVARYLSNQAEVLAALGRPADAAPLHARALEIQEAALGADHPDLAPTLWNAAAARRDAGDLPGAAALADRALALVEATRDEGHPDAVLALANRAALASLEGRPEAAWAYAARALDAAERIVRRSFAALPAADRVAWGRIARRTLDVALRLAPAVGRTGYDEVLRVKGLATRALVAERRLEREGGPAGVEALAALRRAEGEVARLANSVPPFFEPEARARWRAACAAAGGERDRRAATLAKAIEPYRAALERLDIDADRVRRALRPGEALVDVVRAGTRCLAYVATAGAAPERVDLGDAVELDGAALAFAKAAATATKATDPVLVAAGADLARRFARPVEARLPEGTTTLYVCPDGALAAAPLAALPSRVADRRWGDDLLLVHLAMAQDLVPDAVATPPAHGALVLGAVDYERAVGATGRPAPVTARMKPFLRLPGAGEEVAFLRERLGEDTVVLDGERATELGLRTACAGRRVLHLATHGFVREDGATVLRANAPADWLGGAAEGRLALGHDPMLLAGLALAGANARDGGPEDDGILTTLEASRLPLDGAALVVLSACESALGRAEPGEGVVGLVLGFRLAGAAQVMASLWRVDDAATRAFMEAFHRAWDGGRARDAASALRDAQVAVRARPEWAAPRCWAAFGLWGAARGEPAR